MNAASRLSARRSRTGARSTREIFASGSIAPRESASARFQTGQSARRRSVREPCNRAAEIGGQANGIIIVEPPQPAHELVEIGDASLSSGGCLIDLLALEQ